MDYISQTISIGNKLFRSFIKNGELRHAITETIDGKTFTRILDESGNILKQREKTIEKHILGNNAITSITKKTDIDTLKPENVNTIILDSVSTNLALAHWFKGARKTIINKNGSKIVQKEYTMIGYNKGYAKFIDADGITRRKEAFMVDTPCYQQNYAQRSNYRQYQLVGSPAEPVYYNNKGLPVPTILNAEKDTTCANSSLQEMLNTAYKKLLNSTGYLTLKKNSNGYFKSLVVKRKEEPLSYYNTDMGLNNVKREPFDYESYINKMDWKV